MGKIQFNRKDLPLKILNYSSFLQYQRFVMPISFLFYLHNGLTFSDFILFQSIFNITCLCAKIPMGFLGDIFSKKYILIFSYFLFLLRVLLWICFSGFWVILAGEILYGLFKAFYRGNVDSYIYEWLEKSKNEKKMLPDYGKLSFYTSMGSAVSCFAGVILFKYFDFKILLYIELVMQIFAISALFFLPNIKAQKTARCNCLKVIWESICSIIKNTKINYYTYYSAILTGLTSVFVWNFQPLLKLSAAPVFFYGIINFVNQFLRGMGGLFAKQVVEYTQKYKLIKIEYLSVIVSFLLLLWAHHHKNYILVTACLLVICFAIFMFVVFNIFTVSKIHENTQNENRATTSSTNTFFGDFSSFLLLLVFKFLYDGFGFINAMLIFLGLFIILLFPRKSILDKAS